MAEKKYIWTDNPTESGIAKCDTDVLNDCLMYLKYENSSTGYEVGDLVYRMLPTTDASKHLMDGTLFDGNGIFKDFVEYIANLYKTNPLASYFTTEADWQASVEQYGVCGKFVYNASANTVRLPKVTGFVEGTLDANALGDLVGAGLPNITGRFDRSNRNGIGSAEGAFYNGASIGGFARSGDRDSSYVEFDASLSNPIYDNSDTVQPQSILGYMYIVVATSAKTDIEIDIDNVVTDLNNKVDISNMVEITDIGEPLTGLFMPDYTSGISFAMSTNFTAPANGIINATVNGYGGTDAWYWTINGGVKHYYGGNSGGVYPITLLVSKGDVVNIVGTSDTENSFWFYPCKGDN